MRGTRTTARLDLLPQFKSSIYVGSISSYDRTGGNDDGFSGKYSYVAREENGLVIADLEGPGVIYRIWTPTPTDDLFDFYFDGEKTPASPSPFASFSRAPSSPFLRPLVGNGVGGFYSYVPLAYQKSCKIIARAERVQFYQINFARYAIDAPIESWSEEGWARSRTELAQAARLFEMTGQDISSLALPADSSVKSHTKSISLHAGGRATLFESKEG